MIILMAYAGKKKSMYTVQCNAPCIFVADYRNWLSGLIIICVGYI